MTAILPRPVRVAGALALALTAAGLTAACGKKGPPLAPVVATPQRIASFAARRFGDTVHVRLTIPDVNLDGTKARDLDRIEVYAYTAKAPADLDDIDLATPVAVIHVQRPVTPEQEQSWQRAGVPPPPNPGEPLGGVVDVTETLTPALFEPITPKKARAPKVEPLSDDPYAIAWPLAGPVAKPTPKRYYIAQGVSRKGLEGPLSGGSAVWVMAPATPPPGQPEAEVAETAITLTWTPPPEQRAPIQEPASGDVLPATPKGVPASVVYTYNVYLTRDAAADPAGAAGDDRPRMPTPLNSAPLTDTTFDHTAVTFGAERCYVVRSVEVIGDLSQESAASPPVCLTPIDVFPPPVPASLASVASEGAVSLIWDGVEAVDLAGYVVLRSEGPDAPFKPLFDEPIKETTYRDATAKPGVRYLYAVASVDTATPRNVSAPSNPVEETAR